MSFVKLPSSELIRGGLQTQVNYLEMRGGILTLLLVALAVLAAVGMAETAEPQEVAVDVDSDLIVEEETLEAQPETGRSRTRLTPCRCRRSTRV